MDASPRHNRIPETFYRLGVPVSCGLFGVIITLFLNDIPHSYPSLILLGFIVLFTLAHVLWFHRVIQSLRQDLKTSVEAPAHPSVSPNITVEDKQSHDSIIEATFFQHLRNLLSITHPPPHSSTMHKRL